MPFPLKEALLAQDQSQSVFAQLGLEPRGAVRLGCAATLWKDPERRRFHSTPRPAQSRPSRVRSPGARVLTTHECVVFIDSSRSEQPRVDFVPPHLLAEFDL